MTTLPPLPANLVGTRRKATLQKWHALRRYAESGGPVPLTGQLDDDAIAQLVARIQAGPSAPEELRPLMAQALEAQKVGFGPRLLGALRSVGLPFTAFAEAMNAVVGPMVPQEAFQERSARSRTLLKAMFGGDLSPADAAGALRDIYEERSGWEQLITGLTFDPLNVILPGSAAARAGLAAGARAGAKAAVGAAAKAGAIKYLEWQLPFVGGKIAGKLHWTATESLLKEAAGTTTPDDVVLRRMQRLSRKVAGAADTPSLFPRTTLEEQDQMRSAAGWFYDAVNDPARFVGIRGLDTLRALHAATTTPAEKALFQLTLEAAGRGYESAWSRVADILWDDNRVIFRSKMREPGAGRLSPPLTQQTMRLLRQIVGEAPTDPERLAQWKAKPIFSKAAILGTVGKLADRPLGAEYNKWAASLGARAGIPPVAGATIRNLVASAYYDLLQQGGAPVSTLRHFLGHADTRLFRGYAAKGGTPSINRVMLQFMDQDENFVPLATGRKRPTAPKPPPGAAPKPPPGAGLTQEAIDLLAKVDAGGIPMSINRNFERILRANGIEVTGSMTPNEAIELLRQRGATRGATGAQATQEAAERLAAEVRAAPEYAGGISRKGKSPKRFSKSALGRLGEVKLDALDITEPEVWAPRLAAIESDVDHDLLLDAVHALEAKKTILELEQAEEGARLVVEAVTKKSVLGAKMFAYAQAASKERETLALGLRGRLAMELNPRLRTEDIPRILASLKDKGLITEEIINSFLTGLRTANHTVDATLAVGFVPRRLSVAYKTLQHMHMTAPETYEMFRLSGIETAKDIVAANAAVVDWLNIPNVRAILNTMGIPTVEKEVNGAKIWVIQMGLPALITRLHRMATKGSTTQHILGADLPGSALTEANRLARAEAIALHLDMAGRLDQHDTLILKASKTIAKPLGFSEDDLIVPTPRGRRRYTESAEWVGLPFMSETSDLRQKARSVIFGQVGKETLSVADDVKHDIRESPWVAKKIAQLGETVEKGGSLSGFARIGRNALLFTALHAAAASEGTLARLFWGWRSNISKIVGLRDESKNVLSQHPGYRSFRTKMVDPMSATPHMSDSLELADTALDTELAIKYREGLTGKLETAFGGLISDVPTGLPPVERLLQDALRSPMLLFGEEIPFSKLTTIYKLSQDELNYIDLVHELNREGTRIGGAGVGRAALEAFLGQPPSRDYIARIALVAGREKLGFAALEGRKLGEGGIWTKTREMPDALAAYKQQVRYMWPGDAAMEYVADMRRITADKQLIDLLKERGFMEWGRKRWDTRLSASRTLLRLAESLAAGKRPDVEVEYLSKLLNYADPDIMMDSLTQHMGKLATDLVRQPGRAKEILDEVTKIVHKVEDEDRRILDLHNMTKGLPGLGNQWFENTPAAKAAVRYFQEQNKDLMGLQRRLYAVSSSLRMMAAGVDGSYLFIQALLLPSFGLGRGALGAKAWASSAVASLRVIGNNEYMQAYAAHNAESIREFIMSTGVWGLPNEIIEQAGQVATLYGKVPVLGSSLKNLPEAAERMFTAYLLHARLELWKGMRPLAGNDPAKLRELATVVNKMTGVYNPATAGLTQAQRYFEGTWLSFAPMYRRAAFGLLVDAFRGNRLDAKIAREALLGLASAGLSIAYLIKMSGNNPDALDFGSAKFMSANFGPVNIGFGSAYYSLVRAIYAVTEQALDPDQRQYLYRPSQWFNVRDNQLARWWRSQAPPIPQAGIDFVLGQTYVGDPLRNPGEGSLSATALGRWGVNQILPMAAESIIAEVRSPQDSPIVLGEVFGMRTFPLSMRDQYRRLANNLIATDPDPEIVAWRSAQARAGQPAVFANAPVLLRTRMENKYAELQDLRGQVEKDTLQRGRSDQQQRTLFFQQSRGNKEYVREQLQKAVKAFQATHDTERFRDAVREARTSARALAEGLKDRFPDVIGYLDDLKATRADAASAFIGDLIYDKYYSNIVLNEALEDRNGNFQPAVYEDLVSRFKQENGLAWWDYVQKRRKESRQYPDMVEEYLAAAEDLQPYWKLHHTIWGRYSENAQLVDDYLEAAPPDKPLMLAGTPRLRRVMQVLTKQRAAFRMKNPELDWLLTKWYSYVPATRSSRERLVDWEASRG